PDNPMQQPLMSAAPVPPAEPSFVTAYANVPPDSPVNSVVYPTVPAYQSASLPPMPGLYVQPPNTIGQKMQWLLSMGYNEALMDEKDDEMVTKNVSLLKRLGFSQSDEHIKIIIRKNRGALEPVLRALTGE